MGKIGIVMGSDSDWNLVSKTVDILKKFEVKCDVNVLSAHRVPHEVASFAIKAEENGIEVIIAAAGKAAHLPGVIASYTTIPVIGLPVKASCLDGLDALLAIVQMPSGIPVATVAIDGAENAALLAVEILSVKYPKLREKMKEYRKKMSEDVLFKNEQIKATLLKEGQ